MQPEDVVNLVSYIMNETDLLPWQALFRNVHYDDPLFSLNMAEKLRVRTVYGQRQSTQHC